MAKFAHNDVLDAPADLLIARADRLVLCNAQPAAFANVAAATLAAVAIDGSDFTKADGDTNGRKVTVGAQAAVPVTAGGNGNHICLVDDGAGVLLYVTTCPVQAVALDGTVDIAAWDIEFADPA